MDFAEAIEVSKKFRSLNPKVFKGFAEWGIYCGETEGYVVLTDVALTDRSLSNQLEDYVKTHRLRIDQCNSHLMICSI